MILRWLAREVRDFPATSFFCLSWIAVFAAMTSVHLASGAHLAPLRWLVIGFGGGEPFGDLTLNDLARGQVWRLMTCNFVHYSVLHIVLNLLAMYQLGSVLESWYGSHQLVFIYGLTGGGGNLLSALCRWWTGSNREVHSAGGSVVIMGMLGLCAVAGWRSEVPEGKRLSRLVIVVILLTAVLGLIFPRFIDNWGHAGGVVVGAAIGFGHRRLCASVSKPSAWGAGVLTGLLIAGCGVAQLVVDRRDIPRRLEQSLVRRSGYLVHASAELSQLRRPVVPRVHAAAAARWVEALDPILDGPARADLQGLRPLVNAAMARPLTDLERKELDERLTRVLTVIRREYEADRRQLRQLRHGS
jgi:rhomboid protease GluP